MDAPAEHGLISGRRRAAYSALTVARARNVWRHLGGRNTFGDVCEYYHRLEAVENQMSVEARTASRQHDLDLATAPPPTSPYLLTLFPHLYRTAPAAPGPAAPAAPAAPAPAPAAPAALLAQYCARAGLSLREFVLTFREYALEHNVNPSVSNAAFFIKHQMVLERQRRERLAERAAGGQEAKVGAKDEVKRDVKGEGNDEAKNEVTDCNDNDCVKDEEGTTFDKFVKQWEKVKETKQCNDIEKLEQNGKNYASTPHCDESSNKTLEENMKKLTISLRKYGHM